MSLVAWRSRRGIVFILALFFFVLLVGCKTGSSGRIHIDDELVKDIGVSDVDLRSMAREMATALIELELLAEQEGQVVIAFPTITNRTHDVDFNSGAIESMIREKLIGNSKGKFQFLDSELSNLVYEQRDKCRAGTMACSKRTDLVGANYFLKGHASDRRKVEKECIKSASYRYAFHLTDAETSLVIWEKAYEFKKSGQRGSGYC